MHECDVWNDGQGSWVTKSRRVVTHASGVWKARALYLEIYLWVRFEHRLCTS